MNRCKFCKWEKNCSENEEQICFDGNGFEEK